MWWLTFFGLAFAGSVHIDAKIPTEVYANNQPLVQLFRPGQITFELDEGETQFLVMVSGDPHRFQVKLEREPVYVIIGKSGISFGEPPEVEPEEDGDPPPAMGEIELRSTADATLLVQLGTMRHRIGSGQVLKVELPTGEHAFSLRSEDGTAIFAAGTLDVKGGPLIAQVSEGSMPEFSGTGGHFHPAQ